MKQLSDEEEAIRDLAEKISKEKIAPLAKKMDQENKMDPSIIPTLFQNGVSDLKCLSVIIVVSLICFLIIILFFFVFG